LRELSGREVQVEHRDQAALAAEAFVYGFPLVFDLQEVGQFTRAGMGSVPATPLNRFGHASTLAGPQDRFVSINNDTVYSIAQLDLSGGPVRLEVPDSGGRYYVLQFVDAWTNNFAYVGQRATGTRDGSFPLVPPGAERQATDQEPVIRFPTEVATRVGRWAVDGEDDLPAVQALQAGLTLTPLGGGAGRGLPAPDPSVPEDLRFFEQLRVWMRAFPPAPRDLDHQRRFGPLGLLEPASPFWSVTMYDIPDFYLVANPIGGYSIGDRTPGLRTAEDGSLTIVLQHDEPSAPAERANWLPTPAGDFRPILRMYEPGEAVFDGSYELPPVTRRP
jgi:hypothetical protein